jgi:uncharacterized delta-60 repeat protein
MMSPTLATRIAAAILALATVIVAPLAAHAAAGDVNTAFSQTGFTADPIEAGTDIVMTHDGKTLVSLESYNDSVGDGTKSVVARLNRDGTLDTTFGVAGIATLFDFQADESPNGTMVAAMLELMPSGKILLAVQRPIGSERGGTLVRLNADGSLDTAFASAGYADIPVRSGATAFEVRTLTLQQDSTGPLRLLAAGSDTVGGEPQSVVIALTLEGTLDTTWASGGYLLPVTADFSRVDDLITDADGFLFVLTWAGYGATRVASVSKFDVDANVATSFAVGGNAAFAPEPTPGSAGDAASGMFGAALALDAGGNVVVLLEDHWYSDSEYTEGRRMVLTRLLPSGAVDASFATDGRFTSALTPGATTGASGLVIRGDGTIFTAGTITPLEQSQRYYVAAFTSAGVPDASFGIGSGSGTTGVVTFSWDNPDGDMGGLVLTPIGSLLTLVTVGDNSTRYSAQVAAIDGGFEGADSGPAPSLASTGASAQALAVPGLAALLLLAAGIIFLVGRRTTTRINS